MRYLIIAVACTAFGVVRAAGEAETPQQKERVAMLEKAIQKSIADGHVQADDLVDQLTKLNTPSARAALRRLVDGPERYSMSAILALGELKDAGAISVLLAVFDREDAVPEFAMASNPRNENLAVTAHYALMAITNTPEPNEMMEIHTPEKLAAVRKQWKDKLATTRPATIPATRP